MGKFKVSTAHLFHPQKDEKQSEKLSKEVFEN